MLLMFLLWPLMLGITAVIYRNFLAYEEVLNWWFRFGAKYEKRWFHKPIWGCVFCFGGQLALWVYVISWILSSNFMQKSIIGHYLSFLVQSIGIENYSALGACIFVSITIAFIHFFNFLWNKYL